MSSYGSFLQVYISHASRSTLYVLLFPTRCFVDLPSPTR